MSPFSTPFRAKARIMHNTDSGATEITRGTERFFVFLVVKTFSGQVRI